jgi:hypothetical protein
MARMMFGDMLWAWSPYFIRISRKKVAWRKGKSSPHQCLGQHQLSVFGGRDRSTQKHLTGFWFQEPLGFHVPQFLLSHSARPPLPFHFSVSGSIFGFLRDLQVLFIFSKPAISVGSVV